MMLWESSIIQKKQLSFRSNIVGGDVREDWKKSPTKHETQFDYFFDNHSKCWVWKWPKQSENN